MAVRTVYILMARRFGSVRLGVDGINQEFITSSSAEKFLKDKELTDWYYILPVSKVVSTP